jgi:hypothetical protein
MYKFFMMLQQEFLWGWQDNPESNAISWCENFPEIYNVGTLSLWTESQRNLMISRGFSGVPAFEREYEYTFAGYAFNNPPSPSPVIADDPEPELQISDYVDASGFSSWDWCCCFVRKYYMYYTEEFKPPPIVHPDLIFSPWFPSESNSNESPLQNLLSTLSGFRLERQNKS